ncbi:MAG: hypothetical protein R6V44_04640 [Paracoccaceae bacterium]
MSDGDSFIQEVSEELRRDRMYALWRRWGPYVIGLVVAIVVAAAVATWLDRRETAEARRAGSALIEASEAADPAAAFGAVAEAEEGGPALVARLSQGAALAAAGDLDAAAEIYDAVAAREGIEPVYRALAGLKAVMLREPGMTPSARVDALSPHAADGAPFRPLVLGRRAAAHLAAGDASAAAADAEAVLAEPLATEALRERAARILVLSGVDPAEADAAAGAPTR